MDKSNLLALITALFAIAGRSAISKVPEESRNLIYEKMDKLSPFFNSRKDWYLHGLKEAVKAYNEGKSPDLETIGEGLQEFIPSLFKAQEPFFEGYTPTNGLETLLRNFENYFLDEDDNGHAWSSIQHESQGPMFPNGVAELFGQKKYVPEEDPEEESDDSDEDDSKEPSKSGPVKVGNLASLIIALYSIVAKVAGKSNDDSNKALDSEEIEPFLSKGEHHVSGLSRAKEGDLGHGTMILLNQGIEKFLNNYRDKKDFIQGHSHNGNLDKLIESFSKYFKSRKPVDLDFIVKNSVDQALVKRAPWLSTAFSRKDVRKAREEKRGKSNEFNGNDQESIEERLKEIISDNLQIEDRVVLSKEEKKELGDISQELLQEYNKLRSAYDNTWKDALETFVDDHGGNLVNFVDWKKFAEENGIRDEFPPGFEGKIDKRGEWYTDDDQKLQRSVLKTQGYEKVVMLPKYRYDKSAGFYKAYKKGTDKPLTVYTLKTHNSRNLKNAIRVSDLAKKIDSIRRNWTNELRGFSTNNRKSVSAVVLELIYQFGARVGGEKGNSGGVPTFGISTLKRSHIVKINDGDFEFKYPGKDGHLHTGSYSKNGSGAVGAQIVEAMNILCKDKKPNDRVFQFMNNGRLEGYLANNNDLRQDWRSFGGGAYRIHDLRTLKATSIFDSLVKEFREKLGDKDISFDEAKAEFEKICKEVGKVLGHVRNGVSMMEGENFTGKTAQENYISPISQRDFFTSLGINRFPSYLSSLLESEGEIVPKSKGNDEEGDEDSVKSSFFVLSADSDEDDSMSDDSDGSDSDSSEDGGLEYEDKDHDDEDDTGNEEDENDDDGNPIPEEDSPDSSPDSSPLDPQPADQAQLDQVDPVLDGFLSGDIDLEDLLNTNDVNSKDY